MLWTLAAFLLAIGVLVTWHELGHFLVARWCGVHVLRFSVGFGRPLFSHRDRWGTQWSLAPIPLGGYVKMLDEREGWVAPAQQAYAFNRQPVLRRMAIIIAGPMANLLLAVVLYWAVYLAGVQGLRPDIGTVLPNTPAASIGVQAGDTVLSVDGTPVLDWQDLRLALIDALSAHEAFSLTVDDGGVQRQLQVSAQMASDLELEQGNIAAFGLLPLREHNRIAQIDPKGAGAQGGLAVGDVVQKVNGQVIGSWAAFAQQVQRSPNIVLHLQVQRGTQTLAITVTPRAELRGTQTIGRLGLAPEVDQAWLAQLQMTHHASVLEALTRAVNTTWHTAWMTLKMIGRMIVGHVSLSNIGGPITLADYAGQSARAGILPFLEYLAVISISIGVLNLLPIPVLDGGHLMYYTAELVSGRPMSERVLQWGARIGMAVLVTLMAFAIFNDITRLATG